MKIVDLHGLSISLARSAIRSALYTMRSNYLKNFNNNSKDQYRNLVIITGNTRPILITLYDNTNINCRYWKKFKRMVRTSSKTISTKLARV